MGVVMAPLQLSYGYIPMENFLSISGSLSISSYSSEKKGFFIRLYFI